MSHDKTPAEIEEDDLEEVAGGARRGATRTSAFKVTAATKKTTLKKSVLSGDPTLDLPEDFDP